VALQAVIALVEAAALAQPSGKQNSTAAQNLPDFVLIEVSEKNVPVSYANAFLKPAGQTRQTSLMQDSIKKLDEYAQRLRQAYELEGKRAYFATEPDMQFDHAENVQSLPALQRWVARQIGEGADG
jgi:CRISPR system Cascade subunit CasC